MLIDGTSEGLGNLLNVMTELRCFLQSELGDQATDDPLEVTEVSGIGPVFSTFIVMQNQSSFVLKLQSRSVERDNRAHVRAATNLLVARNLSPRTISEGSYWSIHEHGGSDLRMSSQRPNMQELAQLLAKLHNVPPSWFDERRNWLLINDEKLKSRHEFQHIGLRPHVWPLFNYGWMLDQSDQNEVSDWILFFHRTDFYPSSHAAKRVVTTHGDFHFGNILRTPSGSLSCIDLDYCCTTFAIYDIAYLFDLDVTEPQERHDFAQAYLLAMGEVADQAAIDELIFEARCYRVACLSDLHNLDIARYTKGNVLAAIRTAKKQKSNSALRDVIVNGSLEDAAVIWRKQLRSKTVP